MALTTFVIVQFYSWFKSYFPLFWGMVTYDNELKTKEIKFKLGTKIYAPAKAISITVECYIWVWVNSES